MPPASPFEGVRDRETIVPNFVPTLEPAEASSSSAAPG
jgi:hypothetical protein